MAEFVAGLWTGVCMTLAITVTLLAVAKAVEDDDDDDDWNPWGRGK